MSPCGLPPESWWERVKARFRDRKIAVQEPTES